MARRKTGAEDGGQAAQLRRSAVDRLMRYYLCLRDGNALPGSGDVVSSGRIAHCVDMDDAQVRRDLATIGVRGRPKVGYKREEVMCAIRSALGLDATYRAVIVGAGRMGGAVAEYADFKTYGLSIVALFDSDPAKVGAELGGCKVWHVDEMEKVVKRRRARLAILTCPAEVAQGLTDRLVAAGIRAVWNFAPASLSVPQGVAVRNEYVSVGLAELNYFLKQLDGAGEGR